MSRILLASIYCFGLVACGSSPIYENSASDAAVVKAEPLPVEMVISCRVGTAQTRASACLIETADVAGGRLQIMDRDGGKTFADHDLIRLDGGGPTATMKLRPPFRVLAQANGRRNFILHLTLGSSSQVQFVGEATRLETIAIDSKELGLDNLVEQ